MFSPAIPQEIAAESYHSALELEILEFGEKSSDLSELLLWGTFKINSSITLDMKDLTPNAGAQPSGSCYFCCS